MGTFLKDVLGNTRGKIGNLTSSRGKSIVVVRSRAGSRRLGTKYEIQESHRIGIWEIETQAANINLINCHFRLANGNHPNDQFNNMYSLLKTKKILTSVPK